MLKIKIKATGQIIEVKDFSRIIIDEENEEIRELSLNEVELIEEDKEDEKHRDMIASVDLGHKDDITVETTLKDDWYWCSTRKENKRNFVLDWYYGVRDYFNLASNYWVRPVSNTKIK